MARTALTALTVQKMKPPASKAARAERYDAAVPGFGVRVTAEGTRSWIFVYTSPTSLRTDPDALTALRLRLRSNGYHPVPVIGLTLIPTRRASAPA